MSHPCLTTPSLYRDKKNFLVLPQKGALGVHFRVAFGTDAKVYARSDTMLPVSASYMSLTLVIFQNSGLIINQGEAESIQVAEVGVPLPLSASLVGHRSPLLLLPARASNMRK